MRCKCCDAPMTNETTIMNKKAGREEDLCYVCRSAALYPLEEPEYMGGWFPREGVTAPLPTGD